MEDKKKVVMDLIYHKRFQNPVGKGYYNDIYGTSFSWNEWFTDEERKLISEYSQDPEVALALVEFDKDNYNLIDKSFQDDPEFLNMAVNANRTLVRKLSAKKMEEMLKSIIDYKAEYIAYVQGEERARDNFEFIKQSIEAEKARVAQFQKRPKEYLKQFNQVAKRPERE